MGVVADELVEKESRDAAARACRTTLRTGVFGLIGWLFDTVPSKERIEPSSRRIASEVRGKPGGESSTPVSPGEQPGDRASDQSPESMARNRVVTQRRFIRWSSKRRVPRPTAPTRGVAVRTRPAAERAMARRRNIKLAAGSGPQPRRGVRLRASDMHDTPCDAAKPRRPAKGFPGLCVSCGVTAHTPPPERLESKECPS